MHRPRGAPGSLPLALALILALLVPPSPQAVHGAPPAETAAAGAPDIKPILRYSVKNDVSPDMGLLAGQGEDAPGPAQEDTPLGRPLKRSVETTALSLAPQMSMSVQDQLAPFTAPTALAGFEGISYTGSVPPDANGEAGPNHYVQTVNRHYAVWDKSGNPLLPPAPIQTIWQGFGGACEFNGRGDPIVKYDRLADRWLISQLALPSVPPYYECIAVSQTPSPTGSWYRYAFQTPDNKFGDYPKISVWPDAYYMSANMFDGVGSGSSFVGAGFFAFERDAMLRGAQAAMQYFTVPDFAGLLPSDLDGPTPPPAGAPAIFATTGNGGATDSRIYLWRFDVDWVNPSATTFTGPTSIGVSSFDINLCDYSVCIPQPGTSQKLDPITFTLMYRLVYRNFGDYQALVASHTVDVNGADHAGIRWYEFRATTGSYSLYQQGTYAPDADHRWMGSVAMDRNGNIALGYSVSGPSLFPSIRYAGRLAADPLGTLSSEQTLMAGAGSQTSTSGRWGDYTAMVIDPSDDCTFWYTSQYYSATSERNWRTRISAFRFPGCTRMKLTVPAAGPAGVPQTVTVAALDNLGMPVESYRGAIRFTSTDPSATMPPDYTFTEADRGAHTFTSAITFRTPGAQQLSAIDTAYARVLDSSVITIGAAVPGAPTGLNITAVGDQQATLAWTPPAESGGSAVKSYRVVSSPASPNSPLTVGAVTNAVITGLDAGTAYTFTVAAINDAGAGPASQPSATVTLRPSACRYDADRSGTTERAEVLLAVTDYLFARSAITRPQAIEVMTAYLLQQTFTCT